MLGKIHTHNLTPGLAKILQKFSLALKTKGENKIHIQRDLDLTHSEFGNFQKLRYWGILAKYNENGQHVSGYWLLTRNGAAFLRCEMFMPRNVQTQDNHKIGESPEKVLITDLIRGYDKPYWQKQFPVIDDRQPMLI